MTVIPVAAGTTGVVEMVSVGRGEPVTIKAETETMSRDWTVQTRETGRSEEEETRSGATARLSWIGVLLCDE